MHVLSPPADPVERAIDGVGDAHRLVDHRAGVLAREVHQIPHQLGELLDLRDHVPLEGAAVGVGDRRGAGAAGRDEQLDIGAQARQRGLELVPRVGHEAGLALPALPQRDEHLVEARGEARDLVVPGHRDGTQVVGARDAFHLAREAADRCQAGPAHRGAGDRRHRHADAADDGEHHREPVEHRARGAQVLREDQRRAVPHGDRVDLLAAARAQARGLLAADHLHLGGADLERLARRGAHAGGRDDLGVEVGVERAEGDEGGARLHRELRGQLAVDELGTLPLEAVVDGVVQRPGDHEVGGHGHEGHGDAHGTRPEQRHALTERDRFALAGAWLRVRHYGVSRST